MHRNVYGPFHGLMESDFAGVREQNTERTGRLLSPFNSNQRSRVFEPLIFGAVGSHKRKILELIVSVVICTKMNSNYKN